MMVIIILFFILFPFLPARAYLDPGAGGMLVQLIAAGLAGLLMILKLYWKRITGFFKRKKESQ